LKLVLTCEHGGNSIPKDYKTYFTGYEAILNSHRGYDLGTLNLFESLKPLADSSFSSDVSRLLIELNRSLHHPNLFSEFTKSISKSDKESLINSHYLVYRNAVENTISNWISKNETVLHLSIHSFTPILNNEKRHCDIGLLYDSKKINEKIFCTSFKKEIRAIDPTLEVRYNYPYLGRADGFTTYLRKQFKQNYLGIEIEVNQKYSENNKMDNQIKNVLSKSIKSLLKSD
tara:strand:+ start:5907 stop:6596 length:690 start_codon:yes stop_codon:yes gene_type:complete